MKPYNVIVVGGGPAGLVAAARAAELGGRVLLLEKMRKVARKLMITGKGRCNITNNAPVSEFVRHIYPAGRFLKPAFSAFFSSDILALLEHYGVDITLERGGRYFPTHNKAAEIVDALRQWAMDNGVEIRRNYRAEDLLIEKDVLKGVQANGENFYSHSVVLATGGKAYPATGSTGDGYALAQKAGHSVVSTRPALVPLKAEGPLPEQLEGLKLKNVSAAVWIDGKKATDAFGEMEFRDGKLDGAIILTLSRTVVDALQNKQKVELYIDLKPALDHKKLDNRLLRDIERLGKAPLEKLLQGLLPTALVPVLANLAEVHNHTSCNHLSAKARKHIRYYLKSIPFTILHHGSFKEAIITAGGIPTTEIASKTMHSKKLKSLYFAGEIINLDAETGGYNLQVAYSTGWLAGNSCMC